MKTMIDINDDLEKQAREIAKREGTTLRSVIEQGIRLKLQECARQPYRLPDRSVTGTGLRNDFLDKSWGEIREAATKDSDH